MSPEAAELWSGLLRNPEALEPGLRPDPVLETHLRGVEGADPAAPFLACRDARGRAAVLAAAPAVSAALLDTLLAWAGSLQEHGAELAAGRPRILLVLPGLRPPEALRLRPLLEALDLRVAVPGLGGEPALLLPPPQAPPARAEGRLGRLLQALRSLRPPVEVDARSWPWVVRSAEGRALASLHPEGETGERDDRWILALAGAEAGLPLRDDRELDRGIDALLRRHYPQLVAAAAGAG